MWKEAHWRRDFEPAQENFRRESAGQCIWKVERIEESAEGKGSMGMWNETQAKTNICWRGSKKGSKSS